MVVSHQLQQICVKVAKKNKHTYSERASQVTLIQSMSLFVWLVKSSLVWTDPPPVSVCVCRSPPASLCLAWSVSSVFPLFLRPYIVVCLTRPFVSTRRGRKSTDPFVCQNISPLLCLSAEEIPHRKGSLRESVTNRESPCTGEGNYVPTIRWVCVLVASCFPQSWKTWKYQNLWFVCMEESWKLIKQVIEKSWFLSSNMCVFMLSY